MVISFESLFHLNHIHSFIKTHLGGAGVESADTEALRLELTDLRHKCDKLTEENKDLKNRVSGRHFQDHVCNPRVW